MNRNDDTEIEEKPDTSIRGAIRAAIDEVQETGDETDTEVSRQERTERKVPESKDIESKSDDAKPKESTADKVRDTAGKFKKAEDKAETGTSKEPVEIDKGEKKVSTDAKPETKPTQAIKAPVGWTKEGKAAWESLPADVQKSVLKREEEFSNGIKQYADKAKAYDELDQVIAPYKQQISQFGVSPAQTVGKLFEWMNALGHPNQEYKASAFKLLAQSFGFDVNKLTPMQQQSEYDGEPIQTFDPSIIRQTVQQEIAPIQQSMTEYQRQLEEQLRVRAQNDVAEWAKDKPYYEQVRVSMHNLITGGEVPLTADGKLDLDSAYEKAIWLNPEIRQALQEESANQAAKEAQERANREAAQKLESLKRAKSAGVGIKPSAPSMRVNGIGSPKITPPGTKVSVRDSLRLSMQQLREGE